MASVASVWVEVRRSKLICFAFLVWGCGSRTGLGVLELSFDGGSATAGSGGLSSSLGGALSDGGSAGFSGSAGSDAAARTETGGTAGDGGGNPGAGGGGGAASSATGGMAGAGGGGGAAGSAGSATGGTAGTGGSGGALGNRVAIDVAAGAFHTCAAFSDGGLRCWGGNGDGYLGYGNTISIGDDETPDAAGDVDLGGRAIELAASWYHTCALLDSNRVRCWGNGTAGKLGYGHTQSIGDDEDPASAGDVNVGGRAVQLSAGTAHTCAVLDNGKLRCWGSNENWQLGYPGSASIGDDEHPASAGFVDVGGSVVQVAAGHAHTCALLDGGRVRCWGTPNSGRLGYPHTQAIGDDETPAAAGDVDIGSPVVQVVAGLFHTCALLDRGAVRCWGRGDDGRLGYGSVEDIGDDETPAAAGDVDIGGSVEALAAGDFATCALLTTGTVRCWGLGDHGELGYANVESIGDDETPAAAGDVDVGGPVVRIDAGFLHMCATLESGAIRCWGRGGNGSLGYGNTEDVGDDETPAAAGDVKTH